VGYATGSVLALVLGPRVAHVPVVPLPAMGAIAILVAIALCVGASALPVWRAAQLDAAEILQET